MRSDVAIVAVDRGGAVYLGNCHNLAVDFDFLPRSLKRRAFFVTFIHRLSGYCRNFDRSTRIEGFNAEMA